MQDAKNYYRALDHQAIPFKALDKKMTTTSKSLTGEIENLRTKKQVKRFDIPGVDLPLHPSQPTAAITYPTDPISPSLPPPLRPLHQFEMHMTDRAVLFDVLKLTVSYLDRDQTNYSAPERARVENFLRLFVPLLWGVPHEEMEANLGPSQHADSLEADLDVDTDADAGTETDSAAGGDADGSEDGGSSSSGLRKVTGKRGAADLRKRLLVHAAASAGRYGSGAGVNGKSGSRAASPSEEESELGRLADALWIRLTETKADGEPVELASPDLLIEPRRYSFFANSTFYSLIRVLHVSLSSLILSACIRLTRGAESTGDVPSAARLQAAGGQTGQRAQPESTQSSQRRARLVGAGAEHRRRGERRRTLLRASARPGRKAL